MRLLLFLYAFLLSENSFSQTVDTSAIITQLAQIYERDQKTRTGKDSAAFMSYIDSTNLNLVESIIAKYGWPGKSFVGQTGNTAVFLVIQHAEIEAQEKYFNLLKQSAEAGESRMSHLALLQDRILMRRGKKQIYGSQVVPDNKTGGWKIYDIDDEKNVNQRRALVGLEPIEEYAKHFGIDYKVAGQ